METLGMRRPILGTPITGGTRDGLGAADHDVPYRYGFRPTSRWTCPFTAMQYCRLLILRGRLQDGEFADDRSR